MAFRYFLSGASGIRAEVMPEVAKFIDYRLLSMHKAFKGNTKVWCAVSHHKKSAMKEVMLDSGAFTAFMKGHKVTIEELTASYDEVIRLINPKIKLWFINLDVIPGAMGRIAEPPEVRAALDESDKNFKILRKRYGDRVLPVYHQTEDGARLKQIVAMSSFVAFGFRQDFSEQDRMSHAEETLYKARQLRKDVLVHGLATTGYKMLKRTNFDTVDSASWLYSAAMGGILTIASDGTISDMPVSNESPMQRKVRGHYNTITPDEQALMRKHIEAAGATIEQVQSDLSYRILVNAHQMQVWTRAYAPKPVQPAHGLFPL